MFNNKLRNRFARLGIYFATLGLTVGAQAQDCGFSIQTGEYSAWDDAYHGWVELQNNTDSPATQFALYLDLGGAEINEAYQASLFKADTAYRVENPFWLEWQTIPTGGTFRFHFQAAGSNKGIRPYLVSVDGSPCDLNPPSLSLSVDKGFLSSEGSVILQAQATDDAAITKVEFKHGDAIIAVDYEAPYEAEFVANASLNGRQHFSAIAYDTSDNSASAQSSSLIAIGNKFFGTATDADVEYQEFLDLFNQITPGNAGKWGTVERVRDEMNWAGLDRAVQFATDNELVFKMHTLVWGQQQPAWLEQLSPQEQLAEVEQWMSLVAARYGDIPLIDVVNEPLHAVPGYREALGGDGETGWDWLINTFEMARKYFPNSELILNDYNILIFAPFTDDYLEIILLLQERGLIDGIGLQAHFLERAELAVVSDNLDRLAATGLPIYISELDINFADDARQAQWLSQLFNVFWQHPAVLGVTHWGYVEGPIWREDSFLINSNGEARPALEWLTCYLAGNSTCPLPEYIPVPREGDISGVTIEAEDYDEAEGVLALGGSISYVDIGDSAVFRRIQFNNNWDTLEITYAKGNEAPGGVLVYLDEIDDSPEARLTLTNSGGWGSSATIATPWLPIQGEHQVILVFADNYGVGNIDNIRFGASEGLGKNLLPNAHFENDTNGWFTWDGSLSVSDTLAASGASSLLLRDRSGNGPVATAITNRVVRGLSYTFSLWASVGNTDSATVNLTQKTQCQGGAVNYSQVAAPIEINAGEWQNLTAQIDVPDCPLAELLVYAEGPAAGVDIYIDHASLRAQQGVNIVENGNFEADSAGWFTWDGELSATTEFARSGQQSLLHSQRGGVNAPAAIALTTVANPGSRYDVSFWVAIDGAATAPVNLTSKLQCAGEDASYALLADSVNAAQGEWVQLRATLEVPNCALSEVLIYTEGPETGVDLYIDDVSVTELAVNNLLSNGDFEQSSTAGWITWDGVLSVTGEFARSGEQSLKLSGRGGNGPAAAVLTPLVSAASNYSVAFWVSIAGAEQANVNLTQKIECAGESASYSWLVPPAAVTAGEWTQFSGTLEVPDCEITDLLVYAEGPAGGIDIYIDDVVINAN